MSNGNKAAFACAAESGHQMGLTKRELFAAIAMQGLLVNLDRESPQFRLVVSDAVAMADALLAALQGPAQNNESPKV